jgi:hypothetical protein
VRERPSRPSAGRRSRSFGSNSARRTRGCGSSADEEFAPGADHLRADLVEVALAEQTGRRPVTELGVQPLEPRACDLRTVDLGDRLGKLEREPEPTLYRLARLADAVRPLI